MTTTTTTTPQPTARTTSTVALIGNPNTGKSTLFGALSGIRQRVGNYPGVTVEKKLGQMPIGRQWWTLIDLPGTYSLAPRSPDEMVAVDVLLGRRDDTKVPDAVVCVVDADNLERNLYLVSQVLELGLPTVIALTMVDVAQSRGVEVDADRLSQQLGVPVVPVQAHRRQGLDALKEALSQAVESTPKAPESPFPEPFRAEVARLETSLPTPQPRFLVERLLLDVGGYVEKHLPYPGNREKLSQQLREARDRLSEAGCPVPAVEAMARYDWVAKVVDGVTSRVEAPRVRLGDRVDAVLTHRFWGVLILAAVLAFIFHSVFTWAELPMEAIEDGIADLGAWVGTLMPEGPLQSLIADGIIGGIGAVIVFLPQILILFLFIGILEDCGYLARAAYLMDRLMVKIGLSGKSCIPLLSSFACAIPGVMATRVIEDRRDRLITILVAPLMSCSARLPVYVLMIAAFIPNRTYLGGLIGLQALTLFAMYLVGLVTAAIVALAMRKTFLRGPTPPFVMELPAYRWPSPWVVLHRMFERGGEFLKRAGTIIFAVAVLMWAALYYPRLPEAQRAPLEERIATIEQALLNAPDEESQALQVELASIEDELEMVQKQQSYLGRAGHWIEPTVRPLGWDWRIGTAVIASFPAREVVLATMGVIFGVGEDVEDASGQDDLRSALKTATHDGSERPLFTVPVALSIMVFFALCAQCVSTLVVIRRETNSWGWPTFCFVYMTALAYLGAYATYQVGTWLGG